MTLPEILDDAAAAAMAGRRLDPAAALARGERLRTATVRRRALTGFALAACWLVALVGLPLLVPGAWSAMGAAAGRALDGTQAEGSATVGLPQRWWTPPEWTPLVTDRPIRAASVLLDAVVRPASEQPGGVWRVPGTMVISADGRTYRRLPADVAWSVLSPDGRTVVGGRWSSLPEEGTAAPAVEFLHLSSGAVDRVTIPTARYGGQIRQLVWSPDGRGLLVVGELFRSLRTDSAGGSDSAGGADPGEPGRPEPGVWRIELRDGRPTGSVVRLCGCADVVLAYAPGGTLRQGGTGTARVPGAVPLPDAREAVVGSTSPGVALSPDGTRWADVGWVLPDRPGPRQLVVHGPGDRRTAHQLPATMAGAASYATGRVLAWTDRGLILAGKDGVWLTDPELTRTTRLSTGDGGSSAVAAVAVDVAVSGATAPGQAPRFPWWEPERIIDRFRLAGPATLVFRGIEVLVLGGLPLLMIAERIHRPRSRSPSRSRSRRSPVG